MPLSDNDLLHIPERELASLGQDDLLRMVVICREDDEQSNGDRGRAAWKMLVVKDIDRVHGIVTTFRFPGQPMVRIKRDDVDDVVHTAYIRLVKMLKTFRGSSRGEYRAAMRTCVRYECMDHCRAQMEEEKPIKGSLDETIETGDGGSRSKFDADLAKREKQRRQDEEDLQRQLELGYKLRAAIAGVESDDKRRVLEMTIARRSTEEIASELGTSADNVYQLRKRGLEVVRGILDSDDDR
jgi:RNA polymerase sigma factor (sigma-70 family)